MEEFSRIFMVLFLMLGPFKIIAPFTRMTRDEDPVLVKQFAFRGILYSCFSLLLAVLIGEKIISNYGIPIPVLALSGGMVLFLVALLNIVRQFGEHTQKDLKSDPLSLNMAMYPLAFPIIVTPYGIAAVIVFMALTPDLKGKLILSAFVLGIMLLNLVMMLLNKYTFKVMAVILPVLGAILSVIQVALGLQIMYRALNTIISSGNQVD
jgi:multiple antibiotic resistance protein